MKNMFRGQLLQKMKSKFHMIFFATQQTHDCLQSNIGQKKGFNLSKSGDLIYICHCKVMTQY